MARHNIQNGSLGCDSTTASAQVKYFLHIPLDPNCPIEGRPHDRYDLNGVHAALGDVDPIEFSTNLPDGPKSNNYKTNGEIEDGEGVEASIALPIKKGGDNTAITRIEQLADNLGGLGGKILNNMLLEVVSGVDSTDVAVEKHRLYKLRLTDGSIPNSSKTEDAAEYEYSFGIQGDPKVWTEDNDSIDEDWVLNDDSFKLTINDSSMVTTNQVNIDLQIEELADREATITVDVIDANLPDNTFAVGSTFTVKGKGGIFQKSVTAPKSIGTRAGQEYEVTIDLAGRKVVHKHLAVQENVKGGDITIKAVDKTSKEELKKEVKSGNIGEVLTAEALEVEGYSLSGGETPTKEITFTSSKQTVTFNYDKEAQGK